MSNISAVRDRLKRKALAAFGQTVFIRGIEYSAIFNDDEFTDDVGFRRVLEITVDESAAKFIQRGDSVIVNGKPYTIDREPDNDNPLKTFELKDA